MGAFEKLKPVEIDTFKTITKMYRLEPIYSEENTYVLYTPDGKEIEFKVKKGRAVKPKGITFIEWEALKRLKKKMMINEIPVIYEEEKERLI